MGFLEFQAFQLFRHQNNTRLVNKSVKKSVNKKDHHMMIALTGQTGAQ